MKTNEPQPGIRYLVLFRREELQLIRRDLERLDQMGNATSQLQRLALINRIYSEVRAIDRHERDYFENAPKFYRGGERVTGEGKP